MTGPLPVARKEPALSTLPGLEEEFQQEGRSGQIQALAGLGQQQVLQQS